MASFNLPEPDALNAPTNERSGENYGTIRHASSVSHFATARTLCIRFPPGVTVSYHDAWKISRSTLT